MNRLAEARLMVVKVGSALATAADGQPDRGWIAALAADLARLTRRRQKVVVVSSGAVALGRARLGLTRRRLSLAQKQAAAAAGQSRLMRAWEEALEPEGLVAAQVLLTPDDTEVRRRFLNARATLEALLELGVTPIVNENDTVATEELRYGDNDRLAARVAQMIGAELLVLLSDVDGLYSADPRSNPRARHIPEVGAITAEVEAMAGVADAAAGIGSGGMVTKLAAARIAAAAGCATIISLGRRAAPLAAIEAGERATVFTPALTPAAAYKAWIAGALSPQGVLVVDDGAVAALRAGKSLLAAGVRSAEGGFGKGETVIVRDRLGREIGRGLCRYDAPEARRILGLRSAEIEALLGYAGGPLIHADDMALAAGAA